MIFIFFDFLKVFFVVFLGIRWGFVRHKHKEILFSFFSESIHELVKGIKLMEIFNIKAYSKRRVDWSYFALSERITKICFWILHLSCFLHIVRIKVNEIISSLSYKKQSFLRFPSNYSTKPFSLNHIHKNLEILLLNLI